MSEESIQEPAFSRPNSSESNNMVSSSHGVQTDNQQPGPSNAGVTISAADSSTDPSRSAKRNARVASKFPSSLSTEPNSPEENNSGAVSEPGLSEGSSAR